MAFTKSKAFQIISWQGAVMVAHSQWLIIHDPRSYYLKRHKIISIIACLECWGHSLIIALCSAVHSGLHKNCKDLYYCPFVRDIHISPVASPHQGPILLEAFPYHGLIIGRKHIRSSKFGVSSHKAPQNCPCALTLEVSRYFPQWRRPFWMTPPGPQSWHGITDNQRSVWGNMCIRFVVSRQPVDGRQSDG